MKSLTLSELQNRARRELKDKTIEIWDFYERININCYLCLQTLCNCIKDIPTWDKAILELDKGYIYWDTLLDYLTAILSTYMDDYIRENAKERKLTILE